MDQENRLGSISMVRPILLGKVIVICILSILIFCSKSFEAKRKEAISEYSFWCYDHNLDENLFNGPKADSAFIDSATSFRWEYYRDDFKDTLSIIAVVNEGRLGLRVRIFREGDKMDWRKIIKSRY